ncbi:MAG: ribosome small subunit-dependent GTPase A [Sulfitobacter sp.]
MQNNIDQTADLRFGLGWSDFFQAQVADDEIDCLPMRIATVHRARMTAEDGSGAVRLRLPAKINTSEFAVGDWVLVAPQDNQLLRRLDRRTILQRQTAGPRDAQLIAANLDTLLIVTSCNDDFNPARLERYLALANEARINPVVVLTKADQVADAAPFLATACALQRDLPVLSLNAKSADAATVLEPWCGIGQTVALVGSSGVGKSTLLNTLADKQGDAAQETGGIREADAKGRHTTTSRSLHAIDAGGWIIDTPGMRTLHVGDVAEGLDVVFAEITELAPACRFRDCTHMHEPGCAVQAAVKSGTLDTQRLERWRKLSDENVENTQISTGARGNKKPPHSSKRR